MNIYLNLNEFKWFDLSVQGNKKKEMSYEFKNI